ncbi:DUF4373 domain-containing protein [Paenimyroides ceti]
MARPNKIGLFYYNIDTDRYSDIRIRRLKNDFKCMGLCVYDYILNSIYRNGGVLEWDESTAFDVSEYFGLKETQVIEVVNYCCKTGLFNKELFTSERVLTSKSIQERYVYICKNAKIKYKLEERFNLLETDKKNSSTEDYSKSTEETLKSTEDLLKSSEESTQRKEKEKINNKKEIFFPDGLPESDIPDPYFNNSIDWKMLLEQFNKITGKNQPAITGRTRMQFLERLREGFTKNDILNTIKNACKDSYHKDHNLKFINLMYISEAKTMEQYANNKHG